MGHQNPVSPTTRGGVVDRSPFLGGVEGVGGGRQNRGGDWGGRIGLGAGGDMAMGYFTRSTGNQIPRTL